MASDIALLSRIYWNILSLSVIGVAVDMNNILMVKKAR